MAATGYTPISLYYSTTASAVPSAGNLANGELGLNIADMKLYAKNSSGTVTLLASSGGAAGTVSSVAATVPSFLSITGSPITTSGTLAISLSGTALPTTSGGTGLTSFTSGGVVYASSSSALATGSALTFDGSRLGVGVSPSQTIDANGAILSRSNLIAYTALVLQRSSSSLELPVAAYSNGSGSILSGGTKGDIVAFGNAGSDGVIFANSNAEQMRLTSTGLGIGTSSPSYKLDVRGSSGNIASWSDGTTTGTLYAGGGYVGLTFPAATGGFFVNPSGNFNTISTNGVERVRIDSSGNLGLGVTPSAWSSSFKVLQLANGTSLSNNGQTSYYQLGANNYYDGSNYKYIASNYAGFHRFSNAGAYEWHTAASGTAGDNISFTQAMTLGSDGNLLVGTTSSVDANLKIQLVADATNTQRFFGVNNGGGYGLIMGFIYNDQANIRTVAAYPLTFGTNNTERARISSAGGFSVGTTTDPGAGKIADVYGNVRSIPPVGTKTTSYSLATADVGRYVQVSTGGSITIPDATFAEGDVVSIFNNTNATVTITCSITTAYIAGTYTDKATMTLAAAGVATVLFISSTVCVVSGNVT